MYGANEKHFRGYMIAHLGDTPAAALVGGFKEGVGGVKSCYRTRMYSPKTFVYRYVTPCTCTETTCYQVRLFSR